jgi:hypothetical protein
VGISKGAIKLIGKTLQSPKTSGRAITFGVQGVQAGYKETRSLLASVGKQTEPLPEHEVRTDKLTQFSQGIHQSVLFRLLGFAEVESIDYFPNEEPTYTLDLNTEVPECMWEQYDLVYDGGTSEHCFLAPQSLCNALRLVKVGGRVIHHLPLNNYVDHGFYQFSPILFFDLYEANGFSEMRMYLHLRGKKGDRYIEYDPLNGSHLPRHLSRGGRALVFFTAIKTKSMEKVVYPIQGRYRQKFGSELANPRQRLSHLARLRLSISKRFGFNEVRL